MGSVKAYLVGVSAVLIAFFLGQTGAGAASIEDVLSQIEKQEVKTFEADVKMTSKARGQNMEHSGHIAMQTILKDGKPAGHLINMTQTMKMPQGEMSMHMVNDGQFVWSEQKNPAMGGVMVTKTAVRPRETTPSPDVRQMREKFDLKLVGEVEFDGQKMWVLEGTPKENLGEADRAKGMAAMIGKVRTYIGQKDSACHRVLSYDKAGAELMEMQYTNVKVNGTLDPALFKYTPPEGAKVMDLTKGMPSAESLKGMMPKTPKGGEGEGGE